MLTLTDNTAQTDLNREFARASFSRAQRIQWFDPAHYRDAAKVMGRTMNPDTQARLSALCTVNIADIPAACLAWLEELRAAILN